MSESKWEPTEPEVEQLNKALDALGEHWENIQVFCNRVDSATKGTQKLVMGRGNFYARIAQVRDFIISDDAKTAELARRDLENDCGEEG